MITLYRDGRVDTPDHPAATALVVEAGRVGWVGPAGDASRYADGVDRVVDLAGALVTAAFVDAHVHLSDTGAVLRGIDLAGVPSLAEALQRVEVGARRAGGRPLYAPNWDETMWPERRAPTAAELDRASYGGVVYAPRVDGHSAVLSSALVAASGADARPGWLGAGLATREAHHAARDAFQSSTRPQQLRDDIDLALRAAAAAGIGLVHECGGPTVSSAANFAAVLSAPERGRFPHVTGSWGQLVSDEHEAAAVAASHGTASLAGDLNVDGSIGSRTAWLRQEYRDAPGRHGNAYLSVGEVRDHVAACSLAGLQAGFHVIGDAGGDTVVAGFLEAAALVGVDLVRAGRHRLEHLEMVDESGIEALAGLGVTASVQPAFDACWGDPSGMYVDRLGPARAAEMNSFAAMHRLGLGLALGSDSPVTPFAPWEGVRAAVAHHQVAARLDVRAAFDAHTRGGWTAARLEGGVLTVGAEATLTVWDATAVGGGSDGLPALSDGGTAPRALRTVVAGEQVHDSGEL